ncbi:MAG: stage III sporulation protein AE [Limnochordaceae bacterium]|nr:stage III sporulation protein AE [Limnochordaceae bacterium]
MRRVRMTWLIPPLALLAIVQAATAATARLVISGADVTVATAGVPAPSAPTLTPTTTPPFVWASAGQAAVSGADSQSGDASAQTVWEQQLENLDLRRLQEVVEQLDQETRQVFPTVDLQQVIQEKGVHVDWGMVAAAVVQAAWAEVMGGGRLLAQLLLVVLLSALVTVLQRSWDSPASSEAAQLVLLLVVIFLGLQAFRAAYQIAAQLVTTVSGFLYALLPVLNVLLASTGAVATATVLHPLFLGTVSAVVTAVRVWVLPLALIHLALRLAGALGGLMPLRRLSGMAQSFSLTALGLFFTLFLGVLAIQGAVAPVADSLGLRTAKYVSGAFIPVLGGMFADALDVVVGGALLLRNAVGTVGMAGVLILCAFPLAKLAVLVMAVKLCAALAEPLADGRVGEALAAVDGSLTFVTAAAGLISLMFFLIVLISVVVGTLAARMV